MCIGDIALLTLSATLANHLELVEAVEGVIRHKLPVINCCKCLSFWLVLIYGLLTGGGIIRVVGVAFVCAYAAIWLELICGAVDALYIKIYHIIYRQNESARTTEEATAEDTQDGMSELREIK